MKFQLLQSSCQIKSVVPAISIFQCFSVFCISSVFSLIALFFKIYQVSTPAIIMPNQVCSSSGQGITLGVIAPWRRNSCTKLTYDHHISFLWCHEQSVSVLSVSVSCVLRFISFLWSQEQAALSNSCLLGFISF